MKPTLAQIEAFHWIARLGSFQAAAAHLHLGQPTVSVRIRNLERATGLTLFERQGRRVRLTAVGAGLALKSERLLALAAEIAGPGLDPLQSGLRLGAPDAFAMVCLPRLLQLLEREYPALQVALTVENSAVLNQRLNDRELDVAFLVNPECAAHVRAEPLGRQDIAWVASPRLDLPRRPVRPADLARYQLFTNPEPSRLIDLMRDWFARAGMVAPRISTCNSLSVITRLTVVGAGVSLLPTAIIASELRSGSLRRLAIRPSITMQRLFAAYQSEQAGPGIATILSITRAVLARTKFLLP
jgi:DNA-binding transcriptional LysR family regulator